MLQIFYFGETLAGNVIVDSISTADIYLYSSSTGNSQLDEHAKTAAGHEHVVGTECEPDFVISSFGEQELAPGEHEGALQQNDFQIGASNITRYSSHGFSPL